jgi:mono/diheme cytochrome c family protein
MSGCSTKPGLHGGGKSILKLRMIVLAGFGIATVWAGSAAKLTAQDKPAASPTSTEKLSEQARRGEGLFLQRCSLCHLPRKLKFGSPPVIGPSLSGQFKDAGPDQLKILRGFILKGGPDMPGFQYGLEPKEVDDLIVYLKGL